MRVVAFAIMVVLAVISVSEGNVVLALVFGGVKALLVGLGYMELGRSALPHMIGFIVFICAVTGALVFVTA